MTKKNPFYCSSQRFSHGYTSFRVRFFSIAKYVLDLSLPTVTESPPCHCMQIRSYMATKSLLEIPCVSSVDSLLVRRSNLFESHSVLRNLPPTRCMSRTSLELKTDDGVVRFSMGKTGSTAQGEKEGKRVKMSRKAKLNELRFYRLKAKKKMNSANPEVRIRYKLEKAKRKEAWLIEKLRKFEVHKAPAETHDPEILTEEEKHYLKRTGEKKKNYVPVGRREYLEGLF